jgi:hypothetical protein
MLTSLRGTVFDVKRSYGTCILWSAKTPSGFELAEGGSVSGLVRRGVVPEADTNGTACVAGCYLLCGFTAAGAGFANFAASIRAFA